MVSMPPANDPAEDQAIVPADVIQAADAEHVGIILVDWWIARRQRVHVAYLPGDDTPHADQSLHVVVEWLRSHGLEAAYLVDGWRSSAVYRLSIEPTALGPGSRRRR